MSSLQKLEEKLDVLVRKKAPFQMPESGRKMLAGAFWWIALVFGVLQLWAAWELWRLAHYLEPLDRTIDAVNEYFGYTTLDNNLNFFYYLAIIVLVVDGIILLLASTGLKAFKKVGWNLLFYSLLLNVVYGFVRMFSDVGGGIWPFLWSIVFSIVGAYFLFQIRSYFTMTKLPGHKPERVHDDKPEGKPNR